MNKETYKAFIKNKLREIIKEDHEQPNPNPAFAAALQAHQSYDSQSTPDGVLPTEPEKLIPMLSQGSKYRRMMLHNEILDRMDKEIDESGKISIHPSILIHMLHNTANMLSGGSNNPGDHRDISMMLDRLNPHIHKHLKSI